MQEASKSHGQRLHRKKKEKYSFDCLSILEL
jgi:hypothetical protein